MAVIKQTLKLGGRDDVTLGEALECYEKFRKNYFANPKATSELTKVRNDRTKVFSKESQYQLGELEP